MTTTTVPGRCFEADCPADACNVFHFPDVYLQPFNDTCFCDPLYGWTGEKCNETSTVLIWNRAITIFFCFWAFVMFCLSVRTYMLNRIFIYEYTSKPTLRCSLVASLALLFLFLSQVTRLKAFFDSDSMILSYEDLNSDEANNIGEDSNLDYSYGKISRFFLLFGIFFTSLALLALFLSLEELIESILTEKHYRKHSSCCSFRKVFCVYVVLNCFDLLSGLIIIASSDLFPIIEIYQFVWLFTVASTVLLCLVQVCRSRRVIRLLKMKMRLGELNELKNVVVFISLIRNIILSIIVLYIVAPVLIFVNFDKNFDKNSDNVPGEFVPEVFLHDAIMLTFLITCSVVAWYCNSITAGVLIAELRPNCCVVNWWDDRHFILVQDTMPSEQRAALATYFSKEEIIN